MTQSRRVIGIMAKAPIAGAAKTRLIPQLGAEQAALLYCQMLLDSIDLALAALDGDGAVSIICPTAAHRDILQQLVPPVVEVVAHERGDLMHGLSYGLSYHAAQGYTQVLLFNGDSPTLPAEHLRAAFAALDGATVVLGPTLDGGYYLIGASAPQPDLFRWEQLDSATICRQTQERAEARGARVVLLEPWYDIDTAEDFARLLDEFASHGHGASRTRRFVAERAFR
jgi:uncharacterized protein